MAHCGQNSECFNTDGSYECQCARGFAGNSTFGCLMVEGMCPDGSICHRNAECKHMGSYNFR